MAARGGALAGFNAQNRNAASVASRATSARLQKWRVDPETGLRVKVASAPRTSSQHQPRTPACQLLLSLACCATSDARIRDVLRSLPRSPRCMPHLRRAAREGAQDASNNGRRPSISAGSGPDWNTDLRKEMAEAIKQASKDPAPDLRKVVKKQRTVRGLTMQILNRRSSSPRRRSSSPKAKDYKLARGRKAPEKREKAEAARKQAASVAATAGGASTKKSVADRELDERRRVLMSTSWPTVDPHSAWKLRWDILLGVQVKRRETPIYML